jgi:hypothetical protein
MALMDEALADLIKRNEALMSKLNDGTASRDDHRALDATMTEIERRNTESSALATMTRAELMRRNEALMAKVKAGTATRADTERLNNTMAAIAAEDQERTVIKLEASTMDTKSLMERNAELMRKLSAGTATRAETTKLEANTAAIEKVKADADAMRTTMSRTELIRRNEALMAKVKAGTATRADTEQLNNTMAAIAAEDQERTAIKLEASTMDTKSLMERNAELMRKLSAGTATRAETTKLEATMAAIEKAKADADAMRTIEARDELIRRNEALMAKVKAGTATRAEKEKADLSTLEIKRRRSTEESIAKETEVGELLRRNAALMKTMKEGTATRADREELEAVMRRKEELDRELGETKARETKAKLDAARGELRLTERKTAVRDVMRMIKESERTDLCFMIDATSSMDSQIEAVKTQIIQIAAHVQKTNPHLQLRVAGVFYRDQLDDKADGNNVIEFTDDLGTFVSSVGSITAKGGGDACEDVASGLCDALKLKWVSETRLLFHVCDAPSHGSRYYDGLPEHSGGLRGGHFNAVAGQCRVAGDRDRFGNAKGNHNDLGRDGAFEGSVIGVIQLYFGEGFDFSLPRTALEEKGFRIKLERSVPRDMKAFLADCTQLWVISTSVVQFNAEQIAGVKAFWDSGKGVAIWGDNEPYYADANAIMQAMLPGTSMHGNVYGGKQVQPNSTGSGPGFRQHLVTTGIENLYEGITIATITHNGHKSLTPLIYGSAGNLVATVFDDGKRRAIFDGGFTRLFCSWNTAGSARYVKNLAAWLDPPPAWDNHPNGDHGIPSSLHKLKSNNISYIFGRMGDGTDRMIQVFNTDVGGQLVHTVALSSPDLLTKTLTTELRKSMHKTFTASRGRTTHAELRTFVLTPEPPRWELLPALDAQLHMNKEVTDIASLKSSGPLETMLVGSGTAVRGLLSSSSGLSASKAMASLFSLGGKASGEASSERCQIKVAPEPFAAGNLRLARFGQIMTSGGSGGSSATWQPCVFKDFKSKDAKDHLLERYLEEMEVNSVASALAAEFNRTQRPPADRQMRYVLSSVATVETAKGSRTYFAEPFLEGSFTRFSYNTGLWEEDRLDPWLLRFALWTYEVTGGFLMVADLQGIQSDQGFVLTDPVILSTDLRRFGNTNLGAEMMERCKASAEAHLFTMTGGKFSMARSSPRSSDFLSLLEAAEKRDEAVTAILSSKEPPRSRGSPVSSSPPSPRSVTHALWGSHALWGK